MNDINPKPAFDAIVMGAFIGLFWYVALAIEDNTGTALLGFLNGIITMIAFQLLKNETEILRLKRESEKLQYAENLLREVAKVAK